MLVLNLKVNSDKLVDDILKEDNSSETIPKDTVYGIAKRNTLSTASNPNTQPKLSEEQEYYLHLYETQHDKLFNKSDNSPQKIKVYTYAEEHKLPWYVRLINFIKDLFNKIFKRNKN